jgi:hypothetical protein
MRGKDLIEYYKIILDLFTDLVLVAGNMSTSTGFAGSWSSLPTPLTPWM